MSRDDDSAVYDVHAHLISDNPDRYPYAPLGGVLDESVLQDPMTAERFRAEMESCGVHRAVVVQRAHVYGSDNRYIIDAARSFPEAFSALIMVNAEDEASVSVVMEYLTKEQAIGVRLTAPSRTPSLDWLASKAALKIWDVVADLGGTMRVHFYAWNRRAGLEQLDSLARRYPDLPIVVDHLSNLGSDKSNYRGVDDALKIVSDRSNVSLVYSTINATRCEEHGLLLQSLVSDIVALFGPERMMWGSDVGQSKPSYQTMTQIARTAIAELPVRARRSILWETAARIYAPR